VLHGVLVAARGFVVPSYLPARGQALLPWLRQTVRRHCAALAAVSPTDCWDEAVTALLRACVYFNPVPPAGRGAGRDGTPYDVDKAFVAYAKLCVARGLWRYVLSEPSGVRRGRQRRTVQTVSLAEFTERREPDGTTHHRSRHLPDVLLLPSAEDEALAIDTALRYEGPCPPAPPRTPPATATRPAAAGAASPASAAASSPGRPHRRRSSSTASTRS
jgi:hypothetical protein